MYEQKHIDELIGIYYNSRKAKELLLLELLHLKWALVMVLQQNKWYKFMAQPKKFYSKCGLPEQMQWKAGWLYTRIIYVYCVSDCFIKTAFNYLFSFFYISKFPIWFLSFRCNIFINWILCSMLIHFNIFVCILIVMDFIYPYDKFYLRINNPTYQMCKITQSVQEKYFKMELWCFHSILTAMHLPIRPFSIALS